MVSDTGKQMGIITYIHKLVSELISKMRNLLIGLDNITIVPAERNK